MRIINLNDKSGTGKDIAITTVFDIISKIGSTVVTLLIIRILTVDEYADITFFNSIATFLSGVIGSGLTLSFVRYYAESTSRGNQNPSLFYSLIKMIIIAYLLVFSVFATYCHFAPGNSTLLILSLVFGLSLSLVSAVQAFYQASNRFSRAGLVVNTRSILLLLIVLLIALIGGKTSITLKIMISYAATGFITAVCGMLLIHRETRKAPHVNGYNKREMLREGAWLILYCFILNLFNQLDIFMMKHFDMVNDVAQYGVAFKYYAIALSLLPAIQAVLRVKTAEKDIVDSDEIKANIATNWVKKAAPLVIAIVLVGELFAGPALTLLNGVLYNDAIPIFRVLLIGMGISYLTAPNISLMMSGNKQKTMCVVAFISLLSNFFGNYYLIPYFGGMAAAFTTVLSQAILNVSCTIIIIKARKGKLA